jgi:hypothetical protein
VALNPHQLASLGPGVCDVRFLLDGFSH